MDKDYTCQDYGTETEWTRIKVTVPLGQLDELVAVMSMINNYLQIEDYSDIDLKTCYGDLIDESILNADKTIASVSVYVPAGVGVADNLAFLHERFETCKIDGKIDISGVNEDDWANCWKKYYNPVEIGKGVAIVPMWIDYENTENRVIVRMDPGMAFGSGTHETTALCAEFIEKYITKGVRALDVGTGSGILAILASKLGAAEVDALDIDANAAKVAIENCEQNGVNNVRCLQSDLIRKASGKYDFISANIVADIIIRMAENVGDYLKDDGLLVVSGIIERQAEQVLSTFEGKGFKLVDKMDKNDWNAFVFRKA
jgi:ribosomal protein L11 methyltransferase